MLEEYNTWENVTNSISVSEYGTGEATVVLVALAFRELNLTWTIVILMDRESLIGPIRSQFWKIMPAFAVCLFILSIVLTFGLATAFVFILFYFIYFISNYFSFDSLKKKITTL